MQTKRIVPHTAAVIMIAMIAISFMAIVPVTESTLNIEKPDDELDKLLPSGPIIEQEPVKPEPTDAEQVTITIIANETAITLTFNETDAITLTEEQISFINQTLRTPLKILVEIQEGSHLEIVQYYFWFIPYGGRAHVYLSAADAINRFTSSDVSGIRCSIDGWNPRRYDANRLPCVMVGRP